jgi:hypothetical protein
MSKRVLFRVSLLPDEAEVFREFLRKNKLSSITDMVRKLCKMPARNPQPGKQHMPMQDEHRPMEE